MNKLFKTNILPLFFIPLFCFNLFAGSGIPYIDPGTGTPTANRIVKFDSAGKLPVSAMAGSITASQLSSNLSLGGTTTGNFYGTHTGDGSQLTGISASVAFSAVTGSPTDNTNFKTIAGTSTVPVRDSDGNLFVSGIVGGTTTGALKIPSGTTAQRPTSPEIGMMRFNTTLLQLEIYDNANFIISGGTITTSGTYTVHTFTSSGAFAIADGVTSWRNAMTTARGLPASLEYLVVAGGGGGGADSGGGGAGGMLSGSMTASAGTFTVTIGAGGAMATAGNNSVFGSVTATGGGRGGDGNDVGGNGGSGGGGGYNAGLAAGTGIAGQGMAGGAGQSGSPYDCGGGGGDGQAGYAYNAGGGNDGEGGDGLQSSISGTSTYYAGGGAGARGDGEGGLGGGGNGNVAGTANTGGGGGHSQAGGSGIVIIRYPTP